MHEPQKLRILIRTHQESLARRWAETLRPLAAELWLRADGLPPGAYPDVVVADAAAEVSNCGCGIIRIGGAEVDTGSPGTVPILVAGGHKNGTVPFCPPDEVDLPADATARELLLACRLVARVSRLQQRLDAEAALRRRFRDEAMTDPLTGLPNRRAWDEGLERRLASGSQPTLCLAILDLDHFKSINDIHGHAVGDQVLRQAGEAAAANLRQADLVARLGGDEFGLLLALPDATDAGSVVERLRTALPARLVRHNLPVVTASAGYRVASRNDLPDAEAFYASADEALRSAKRLGRDQTVGTPGLTNGVKMQNGS